MKPVGVKSENEPDNEVDQRENGQKDALANGHIARSTSRLKRHRAVNLGNGQWDDAIGTVIVLNRLNGQHPNYNSGEQNETRETKRHPTRIDPAIVLEADMSDSIATATPLSL